MRAGGIHYSQVVRPACTPIVRVVAIHRLRIDRGGCSRQRVFGDDDDEDAGDVLRPGSRTRKLEGLYSGMLSKGKAGCCLDGSMRSCGWLDEVLSI